MHRITITLALACTLQACFDSSQDAFAASLGTVLNENFSVPLQSKPPKHLHPYHANLMVKIGHLLSI